MTAIKEELDAVLQSLISISNDIPNLRGPIFKLEAAIALLSEPENPENPENTVDPPKSGEFGGEDAAEGFVDGAPVTTPEPETFTGNAVTEDGEDEPDSVTAAETGEEEHPARKTRGKNRKK